MDIILFTEYIGIASASLSGFLFGVKKQCDLLGLFLAAMLTGIGGGIARDIIVGRDVYSFTNYPPMCIVLFMMAVGFIFELNTKHSQLEGKFLFIFTDAIDVIAFSIVGSMIAIEYGYNVFGVIMVAFCNGVGGGIFRDILLNEVPWFLRTGLYGSISMAIGLIYFIMHHLGLTSVVSIMTLLGFGVAFRMVAYYKKWHLPVLNLE